MHEQTRNNLDCLATWTKQVVNMDSFLIALEAGLPEREDDDVAYNALDAGFSSITLDRFEAASVDEVKPLLLLARKCGFKRSEDPKEDEAQNLIRWRLSAPIAGEADYERMSLQIVLHFRTETTGEGAATCGYVTVGKMEVDDRRLLCGDEFQEWTAKQKEESETVA